MKLKENKKLQLLLIVLCVVLIAAVALVASGVIGGKNAPETAQTQSVALVKDGDVVGEGKVSFPFVVEDHDGNQITVTVKTDKKMVGEALLDAKLIEGEKGPYGLYVKKVNGIMADYDVNQTYWAFYIDGAYAMTGVDVTEIVEGSTYMMKVEK